MWHLQHTAARWVLRLAVSVAGSKLIHGKKDACMSSLIFAGYHNSALRTFQAPASEVCCKVGSATVAAIAGL
jgi:2-methylcitrate dehydratase PrpD